MKIKIAKVTSIRVQHVRRAHHIVVLKGRKGANVKRGKRGKSCCIIPHIFSVFGVLAGSSVVLACLDMVR